jgi:hypothetical protein
MKGDQFKCPRCGREWNVMSHDGHVEQRGYKYEVKNSDRGFLCPCRGRSMPSRKLTESRKWREPLVIEGEIELYPWDDGGVEVRVGEGLGDVDGGHGESLDHPIRDRLRKAIGDTGYSELLSGRYRITIERIDL